MMYSERDQLCVYILVIFFVPQAARLSGVDHTFSVERCQMGTIRRGQHHRHDVALSIRRGPAGIGFYKDVAQRAVEDVENFSDQVTSLLTQETSDGLHPTTLPAG